MSEIHDDIKESADVEKARKAVDPNDYDGPDDPMNPWNWPDWKRRFHVVGPALVSFASTLGSSIVAPGVPAIEQAFHVSSTVAILTLSIYILGLAFAPVLAAPLSETYGRRAVYLVSIPLGALFTLGAGFSQNIWSLCICRFFTGLALSPALAVGSGSIADMYLPQHRATPSALYILSPFVGPSLGPVIGSFVTVRKSWRWTQWTLIFFSLFAFLSLALTEETHKKTRLARRNKKLGLPAPPSPFPSTIAKIKFLMTVTLVRPMHMLLTEPIVGFMSLYTAFNFSVLYSFFAAFPYVFGTVYGFDTEQSGLVFLSIGIGSIIGALTVVACDRLLYQPQSRKSHAEGRKGVVAPEHRLYPAVMGTFGLPIGLFWFAWTARSDISWASPVVSAIPFAWGNVCIFISTALYLIDTYQALAGASAIAANGFLRYLMGAAFPLFTLQMYERLGIAWATSLLAFITVTLMPIPWIIFRFGPALRKKSSYDTLQA